MTDYIRKAVELADGWSVNKTGQTITSEGGYFGNIADQETLDALAAQLVRQCDAIDGMWVEIDDRSAGIYTINDWGNKAVVYVTEEDSERTTNTIKAIVDSGVLE